MVSNIFSNSNLNGEGACESKVVRLGVWEEARGCLKEVDVERGRWFWRFAKNSGLSFLLSTVPWFGLAV